MRDALSMVRAKAVCIQQCWRRVICDPAYKMCRDRLLREFNDMS